MTSKTVTWLFRDFDLKERKKEHSAVFSELDLDHQPRHYAQALARVCY